MKLFIVRAIGIVVLLPVARAMFMIVPASGVFNELTDPSVDKCRALAAPPGPEEIQIDHESGIAYISASQRRGRTDGRTDGIYSLDLNDPGAQVRRLVSDAPPGFAPHGISLLSSHDLLFVVNHPNGGHAVEIFQIAGDGLRHLETITSDLFTEPNDIVAVGPRAFYVSNFQSARTGLWLTLERYLGLPTTDVVYHDRGETTITAAGLVSANGINLSQDGSELYVAELLARKLSIYKRDPASGELGDRRRISIGTAPDNIDVGEDGRLYIAAHPNLLAFPEHASDETAISPSQVIRFDPADGGRETMFMSVNGDFNGSSVGAYWKGNLLIGGVHDPKLMWCRF